MLHLIDQKLKEKIKELRKRYHSDRDLAHEIGVAHTTLLAWMGKGMAIRDVAYQNLIKCLIRHGILTQKEAEHLGTAPISNAEIYDQPVPQFPIISDVAASECSCYMPIADYAEENSEEMVGFSEGKPGDFVVRVTGNSMLPWYPEGTLILARPNCSVKNGDRVIAVLRSGEVVFKIFAEKGDYFYLFPINGDAGEKFQFRKNDFGAIRAIYGIIQSMRDEQAIDRAMEQAGIKHAWQRELESTEDGK